MAVALFASPGQAHARGASAQKPDTVAKTSSNSKTSRERTLHAQQSLDLAGYRQTATDSHFAAPAFPAGALHCTGIFRRRAARPRRPGRHACAPEPARRGALAGPGAAGRSRKHRYGEIGRQRQHGPVGRRRFRQNACTQAQAPARRHARPGRDARACGRCAGRAQQPRAGQPADRLAAAPGRRLPALHADRVARSWSRNWPPNTPTSRPTRARASTTRAPPCAWTSPRSACTPRCARRAAAAMSIRTTRATTASTPATAARDLVNEHGPLVEGDHRRGAAVPVALLLQGRRHGRGARFGLRARRQRRPDPARRRRERGAADRHATADKDGAITVALQPGRHRARSK